MLRGAERAGVGRECLDRVDAAIRRIEELIETDVGDRDALDALLSDWVHESRAGFQLRQKAAAFKAMSALRGVQANMLASCWIVHPSSKPGVYDTVEVESILGCRRIRPNAALHTMTQHLSPEPHRFAVEGLAGRPVESMTDVLLAEFSSPNLGAMQTLRHGTQTQTIVRDLPLGKSRGTDRVTALVFRNLYRSHRLETDAPTTGVAATVEPPAQDLLLDVLLHDDVWPDLHPELRVFDTAVRGLAHPDDPIRQADRLEVMESVVSLGHGVAAFRVAEIPRYTEMIQHVCNQLGWDAQRLRGYRCKIHYPVYGSQVCLAFRLPSAPAQH